MILISKKECELLQKEGFKFGRDLNKTVGSGKKRTYYATESQRVMETLNKIRTID